MFFIGVMGIDRKEKEIKIMDSFPCKNCDNKPSGKLIKAYTFFHFFFIPIFRWNENYYILCNGCNSLYEISKDKGKKIEDKNENNISYWDLNTIRESGEKCRNCNALIDSNYEYCPHCGEKIL